MYQPWCPMVFPQLLHLDFCLLTGPWRRKPLTHEKSWKWILMRRWDRLCWSGAGCGQISVWTKCQFIDAFYLIFPLVSCTCSYPNHHGWIPGSWTVRWATTVGTWGKIQGILLSRCYLRHRGMLRKLGKKNLSLVMDTNNAGFTSHKESQLGNCAEISSDSLKHNSGRGRLQPPTHSPPAQKKRKNKHMDLLALEVRK